MPNRNSLNGSYRYAYQGQEKDAETGKEAFQLRLYDGRIGRWLTTDPAHQFDSPYIAMGNNPVNAVDPDGAECEGVGCLSGDYSLNLGLADNVISNNSALSENFSFDSTPNLGDGLFSLTPVIGSLLRSGDRLNEGKYLESALEFGVATVEAFTLGAASTYVAPSRAVTSSASKSLLSRGKTFTQYKASYWGKNVKPVFQPIRMSNGKVFKVHMELHHKYIPQRWKWAPNWLKNNSLNLEPLNTIQHAAKDPYRFRFLPKEIKNAINSGNTLGY